MFMYLHVFAAFSLMNWCFVKVLLNSHVLMWRCSRGGYVRVVLLVFRGFAIPMFSTLCVFFFRFFFCSSFCCCCCFVLFCFVLLLLLLLLLLVTLDHSCCHGVVMVLAGAHALLCKKPQQPRQNQKKHDETTVRAHETTIQTWNPRINKTRNHKQPEGFRTSEPGFCRPFQCSNLCFYSVFCGYFVARQEGYEGKAQCLLQNKTKTCILYIV